MKRCKSVVVLGTLLVLIVLSLRRVLFVPGLVGFTWDWAFPPYAEQWTDIIKGQFSLWNDIFSLGYPKSTLITFYFWFIMGTPALFDIAGEYIIKLYLVSFLLLAGCCMLFLTRKLGFCWLTSSLCAIYFMFSPSFYSRIIAGHLNMVMGYALIPLFLGMLIGSLDDERGWFRKAVFGGIFFSLIVTHESLGGVSILLLAVFVIIGLRAKRRLRGIYISVTVLVIFILLHSWWLVAFLKTNLGGTFQFRGGVTAEEISAQVLAAIKNAGVPIWNAIRGYTHAGLGTEYVFPPPPGLEWLWHSVSFILPGFILLGLIAIIIQKKFNRWTFFFSIILLLGIILYNGMHNPVGYLVYMLMAKYPFILAVFTRVGRFIILISLGYAVLLGYTLELYRGKFGRGLYSVASILVLLYTLPFLSGRITEPILKGTQPLCLLVNKISPDDRRLYEFLSNQSEDFRVSYFPPPGLSYVGETEHTFEWMYQYSPKPEFLGQISSDKYYNLFVCASLFQPQLISARLSKLFGLANVRYIIFPYYKEYFTYASFGHLPHSGWPEILFKAKGSLEEVLKKQDGLELRRGLIDSNDIKIYENKDCLPHINPVNEVILSSGDFASLIGLTHLSDFSFAEKALFYTSGLDSTQYKYLQSLLPRYLMYNNNFIDLLLPYLPSGCVIYPGYYCKGFYSKWFNLTQWWDEDWHFATTIIKAQGAQTHNQGELIIDYETSNKTIYKIYSLIHFGPKGSLLNFHIDNKELNRIYTQVPYDLGFRWVYLGEVGLDAGWHKLIVKAENGYNAILKILVVPEGIIGNAFRKVENHLENSNLLLVNEAEDIAICDSEGLISNKWIYSRSDPEKGLSNLYTKGGIEFSHTDKYIMPIEYKGQGSIVYKIEFPSQTGKVRFVSWPRIHNDPERRNYVKAYYSVDGENFVTLYELSSNGDDKWTGIYEVKMDNQIDVETGTIYLKFELNNYAQLWADEEHAMELTAERSTGLPKVILDFSEGCSNGKGVILPVSLELNIPVPGDYEVSIRGKFEEGSDISLRLDKNIFRKNVQASNTYQWYNLGTIQLQKGFQRVDIGSSQKGSLDLIVLRNEKDALQTWTKPLKFEYKKINPAKYKIRVSATNPFAINFSETYSPKWQAVVNGDVISSIPLYGFANFYYIKKLGEYEFTLEYLDQKYLKIGQLLTISSWVVLLFLLLMIRRKL